MAPSSPPVPVPVALPGPVEVLVAGVLGAGGVIMVIMDMPVLAGLGLEGDGGPVSVDSFIIM